MIAQWVDTRDRQPTVNGDYLTQTACGGVGTTMYTVEGGWSSGKEAKELSKSMEVIRKTAADLIDGLAA